MKKIALTIFILTFGSIVQAEGEAQTKMLCQNPENHEIDTNYDGQDDTIASRCNFDNATAELLTLNDCPEPVLRYKVNCKTVNVRVDGTYFGNGSKGSFNFLAPVSNYDTNCKFSRSSGQIPHGDRNCVPTFDDSNVVSSEVYEQTATFKSAPLHIVSPENETEGETIDPNAWRNDKIDIHEGVIDGYIRR